MLLPKLGEYINFPRKLNIFMLANASIKEDQFAEEINATIDKLISP